MLRRTFLAIVFVALACARGMAESPDESPDFFDMSGIQPSTMDAIASLAAIPAGGPNVVLAAPEAPVAPAPPLEIKQQERKHEQKVTGREFVFHDERGGIPVNTELEVCAFLVDEARADCGFKGFVKETSPGEAHLFVNMKTVPDGKFLLLIGGAPDFIDGNVFRTESRPFTGHFPGSHGIVGFLKKALKVTLNVAILSVSFGPIAGPAIYAGGELAHLAISHAQRKAHEDFVRFAGQRLITMQSTQT